MTSERNSGRISVWAMMADREGAGAENGPTGWLRRERYQLPRLYGTGDGRAFLHRRKCGLVHALCPTRGNQPGRRGFTLTVV